MIIIQSTDSLEVKIPRDFDFKSMYRPFSKTFFLEIYGYGIIVYLQTKNEDIVKTLARELQIHKEDKNYAIQIFVDELRSILKITGGY